MSGNCDRSIIEFILAKAEKSSQTPEDIVKTLDEIKTQKNLGLKGILKFLKDEGAAGAESVDRMEG